MKSLVIYDSNFGNTQIIAEAIASELNSKAVKVNEFKSEDLEGIDMLIVGSPIIAWRPTPRISEFIKRLPVSRLKNMSAAAFDTRVKIFISGNAAKRISKALEDAGATIIADPMGFYVKDKEGPLLDGEADRARKWGSKILSNKK